MQATYENMEDNIIIKKSGKSGYWEMNKEAMKDAISRYDIKIETASSAHDNMADRRDDAIAKYNLWLQAMGAWVPVDMTELFKDVLWQFEVTDTNRFIKDPQMEQLMGWWQWGWNPLEAPQWQWLPWAADLTTQVAWGKITSAI